MSEPVTIVQMIEAVGVDKVGVQVLNIAITGANSRRGGGTEVRFITSELHPSDLVTTPRRVGLIVWMDTADYERVRKELTGAGQA